MLAIILKIIKVYILHFVKFIYFDKMNNKDNFLKIFVPIAKAVSALLEPHGEVVIHDLASDSIYFICGNYSGRKPGDESLLGMTEKEINNKSGYPPYFKSGPDGSPQRSVSAVLADETGKPRGLFCVNVEIGELETARKILSSFMACPRSDEQPEELFAYDWREQMNLHIGRYLTERNKKIKHLTKAERCELCLQLKSQGLLEAKNSITHLADSINVTRATIYNYLNKAEAK